MATSTWLHTRSTSLERCRWEDCVLYVFGFAEIDDHVHLMRGLCVLQVPLNSVCVWACSLDSCCAAMATLTWPPTRSTSLERCRWGDRMLFVFGFAGVDDRV
jgi:hypothetical protein